ncbi:hypothetical protein LPW36_04785 [Jinshanibacter sp. LJY008]|uniref:Uncharacterized protein n=1 Tax=Limnobaculum eriocheiris TaxID=2897391 RepID=A0A9X1SJW8_9GAMM|nr:hypothetical protein [Limnobaculum eriocheiris]MCD1125346.1 hypothetical protein [Limnobaculum eriocheiris]
MHNLIDKTPLTSEELASQCVALTHAALFTDEVVIREALLFILLEKTSVLYEMLPEPVEVNHA